MDYLKCDSSAVKCLVSCISYALLNFKKIEGIDINDIESLRETLRILRPNAHPLKYCDALIQIEKRDLVSAINSLRELLQYIPDYPSGKAILAKVLFEQKDPNWKSLASEIIEDTSSTEEEVEIVHIIWKNHWTLQGTWSQEKSQQLDQERALRFQSNTDSKNDSQVPYKPTDIMQPYTIRM